MKDEAGHDIKLSLLKTPISLDSITVEYKDDMDKGNETNKLNKNKTKAQTKKRRNTKINKPFHDDGNKSDSGHTNDENNVSNKNIAFLEEPIPVNFNWDENKAAKQTFKVKTIEKKCIALKKKPLQLESWKLNALTIFENSFVYPFIHASNKYKCFVCGKQFLEPNILKDHTINEHNTQQMKKELTNRMKDQYLKVDVTYLQCKICTETQEDLEKLKIHLTQHGITVDLNITDNLIPFKLGGDVIACQICGEIFLKLRLLIIHMSKHFNNFSCEICGSVFISMKLLKSHLQVHKSGSFPCHKCNKVFNNSSKRSMHIKGVHLKQYSRTCPFCSERFNSNYQRAKHLRIVHNQTSGTYRCESCSREYDLKYHLLLHIRSVHLQERNHECLVCHARFFSKYCLTRHEVIHSGEKNFKCQLCGKAYARRKNLREHLKSHDEVPTFFAGAGEY